MSTKQKNITSRPASVQPYVQLTKYDTCEQVISPKATAT